MAAGVFVLSGAAGAQVGYPPERSPFVDVDTRHEITPMFGYFSAKRDPAKVAPQSGTLAGLMYEWRASGPVHLGASFMSIGSKVTVLDPSKPLANREVTAT